MTISTVPPKQGRSDLSKMCFFSIRSQSCSMLIFLFMFFNPLPSYDLS